MNEVRNTSGIRSGLNERGQKSDDVENESQEQGECTEYSMLNLTQDFAALSQRQTVPRLGPYKQTLPVKSVFLNQHDVPFSLNGVSTANVEARSPNNIPPPIINSVGAPVPVVNRREIGPKVLVWK